MDLPRFKYHPDPVATGSVAASDAECPCCQKARGFAYTGPVYSTEEIDGLCPWCIADASAHERYKCEFVDAAGIGGYEAWDAVPEPVIEEVAYRTPGFSGWQQERWWTHCGDAAEFLGPVGREEALRAGNQFLTAIRTDAGLDEGPQWTEYLQALQRDRGPTAYLFRCRHCGQLGGYSDIH
jgi:uncharacterized protein CbrC (UPF0167 family)